MALSILDGNQTATTLSTVVTSGQHITAHTIVSLGAQAITEITGAVSGSVVTIPNLNVLARSVATEGIADATLNFVKIGGHQDGSNQTAHIVHVSGGGAMKVDASDSTVTFGAIRGTVTIGNSVTISSLPPISGTVTVGNTVTIAGTVTANPTGTQTISGSVTIGAGTAQIGTVTASNTNLNRLVQDGELANTFGVPIIYARVAGGELDYWKEVSQISGFPVANQLNFIGDIVPFTIAGSVTIGAGTAQIGSVTASISGTVPVSGTFFQGTQPVSLAALPTLAAGTAQIGSVTASISGTVPISISSVTVGNSVTIGNFPATQAVSLASVPTHGVTLASTTVTVSALPRPTWTNYSGSITTANTAITAISTTTRSYLLAQVTTGQLFINIGATATTINSVYFSAGQGFAWETSVPQGIVSIISTVTATKYVLKEG